MKTRLISIDLMRGIAILFMILCHFAIFLSPLNENSPWLYFFSNHLIGDLAAPCFLFLAGFSQNLSNQKGSTPIRRGLAIFGLGLLFSVAMHGPEAIFEWDILPLIGASTLLLYALRKTSPTRILLTAVAVVAVTPVLRMHSDWLAYWGGKLVDVAGVTNRAPAMLMDPVDAYKPAWGLVSTLKGFLLVGYFPVFPWIGFPLVGYAIGKMMIVKKMKFSFAAIFVPGLILSIAGQGVALLQGIFASEGAALNVIQGYLSPLSFYPLTPTMFSLQLGVALMLLSVLKHFFDDEKAEPTASKKSRTLSYFQRLSRYSLTVYVLHHLVIFWPIHLIRFVSGADLYEKAMSTPAAFSAGLLLIAALGPILYWIELKNENLSLEWWLAKVVAGRSPRPLITKPPLVSTDLPPDASIDIRSVAMKSIEQDPEKNLEQNDRYTTL